MTDRVHIAGVGSTIFGRHADRTLRDLAGEAIMAALTDSAIPPHRIGAAYCGNALAPLLQGETGVGQNALWEAGIAEIPVFNVENACASGSTALHLGWQAIISGQHDAVLVLGVEKAVMPKGTPLRAGEAELDTRLGSIFPAYFAMVAQKHAQAFGTTPEQMAQVSVKNHANGCLNPMAQYNKPVTVEDVLTSPMVADPITLLSCCPNSDGAAAVILCNTRLAAQLGQQGISIAASVYVTGRYDNDRDFTFWACEEEAANAAYAQAGIGPGDLSLVEVHDAFTICEILHYEGLGLCARGEGGALITSGATTIGGRIPVNPSGGLLAKGHPAGASGVGQIVEIVQQLRGRAERRQIAGARTALAHMMGGAKDGDARACTMHLIIADKAA